MKGTIKHGLMLVIVARLLSLQALCASDQTHTYASDETNRAYSVLIMPKTPEADRLRDRAYRNWVPSKVIPPDKCVAITGGIASDGKLYDLKVESSSGDAQLDADCLQAVMAVSGLAPFSVREGELEQLRFMFDRTTKNSHTSSGICKYFASHPDEEHTHVAFYRIPLEVLQRYPGLFTEDELLDDSNIGTILVIDEHHGLAWWGVDHLRYMYQGTWIPFFSAFPHASKQQILDLRNRLLFDVRPRAKKKE